MSTATAHDWAHLDLKTREELDEQYLAELHTLGEPGLTDEGIEVYLAYRHERPELCMTTFELGQIHKLLHDYHDPALIPDPVEQEEHIGWLENFGAYKLHLTNAQTYVWIMLVVIIVAMVAFVVSLV